MAHIQPAHFHGAKYPLQSVARFLQSDMHRESDRAPAATPAQPAQTGSNDSPLLWGFLGAIFVGLVVGYPVLMACLDSPHAVQYLLRLAGSALAFAALGVFVALACRLWRPLG